MSQVDVIRRKPVQVTLSDGMPRDIKFTLNVLADIEDKFGSVDAGFELLDKGNMKAVRFILWAGLVGGGNEITEHEVGNLIDLQYLKDLMEQMGTAMKQDAPAPAAAEAAVVVQLPNAEQNPNK